MSRLPDVLSTDDLPLAELCAARIDGDVVRLADGWTAIDEPDLRATRAAAVALAAPPGLIVARRSAAWVHGAVDAPPSRGQFVSDVAARRASILDPLVDHSEYVLDPGDVAVYGAVRCTTPARTAFDLARDAELDDAIVIPALTRLLHLGPEAASGLDARLSSPRHVAHIALARRRRDAAVRHVAAGTVWIGTVAVGTGPVDPLAAE